MRGETRDTITVVVDSYGPCVGRLRSRHNPAAEATWLDDQDVVIGYAAGDQAWAYPLRVLNFHEIVNDTLDGDDV